MRRNLLLAILILFISFISLSKTVFAEEYETELVPKGVGLQTIEVGKVKMDSFGLVTFFDTNTKKGTRIEILSQFSNNYSENTTIVYTIKLYDRNQSMIYEYSQDVNLDRSKGGSFFKKIYNNEEGFEIDSMAFYSVKIEVPLKTQIFDGADKGSYFFHDYYTTVDVKLNNVYNIKQSFDGTFKGSARAINLYIPYRHVYTRGDGKEINRRAIISNVNLSDRYVEYIDKGRKILTVGESDASNLEKHYELEYTYNVGKDNVIGNDEMVVYFIRNLEADVNGINFEVNMPKEFNKEEVSFIDEFGSKIENVEFEVDGNTIKGKINEVVSADSSIAIKVLLHDGYFVNASSNISDKTKIAFVIPIIFAVITVIVSFISTRKKNKLNEKVGMYLEEDIDSLELGYVLKGGLKETDISSLIFCLANKKFIEIDMHLDGNYSITRTKEYTGDNKLEEILMKRLFQNDTVVTRKDLKSNLMNIKEEMEKHLKYKKKDRLYIHPIVNYKLVFWVMIYIIYYLVIDNIFFEYQPKFTFINTIAGFIGLILILGTMSSKKLQGIEKLLCSLAGIVLVVSPIMLTSYEAFIQDKLYIAAYVTGIMCVSIISISSGLLSNRTVKGNYLYRKIVAYKSVLTNLSEDEILDELVKNDKYFYEVLPYVLVMGMSDKFYEKFQDIPLNEPSWYETPKFNLENFYEQVKNIYSDFYIAIKNNR